MFIDINSCSDPGFHTSFGANPTENWRWNKFVWKFLQISWQFQQPPALVAIGKKRPEGMKLSPWPPRLKENLFIVVKWRMTIWKTCTTVKCSKFPPQYTTCAYNLQYDFDEICDARILIEHCKCTKYLRMQKCCNSFRKNITENEFLCAKSYETKCHLHHFCLEYNNADVNHLLKKIREQFLIIYTCSYIKHSKV